MLLAGTIEGVAMLIGSVTALIFVLVTSWLLLHRQIKTISVEAGQAKVAAEMVAETVEHINQAVNSADPGDPTLRERVINVEDGLTELKLTFAEHHRDMLDRLDLMALAIVGKRVLDINPDEDTGEHRIVP